MDSYFLAHYLDRGLSEIVVLIHEYKESATGHIDEYSEVVAARKGRKFVKVSVYCKTNHYRTSASSFRVDPEPIDETTYRKLTAGKPTIDTEAARAAYEEDKEKASKKAKIRRHLEKKLASLTPKCPNCNIKLTLRSGPHGLFWGCTSYPHRKYTKRASPAVIRLNDQLRKL
jgi:hypothetical protein